MELAFVEVSNDGQTYFRFKSYSNTDTINQIASFGEYTDCRLVEGLAGKYIANYGTPFDLDEFLNTSNLNLNAIRYIKIKDVVGSINRNYCSYDNQQNIINDPYPTDFNTGGFDLDALGVIHQLNPTSNSTLKKSNKVLLYPNPCETILNIETYEKIVSASIFSFDGKCCVQFENLKQNSIDISSLKSGNYLLQIITDKQRTFKNYFSKK